MPLLRLEDVSLAYGHVPLLKHLNFQIDRGERVCLVGRNGAGKTTLLRVISGLAEPDEGEIWRHETLRTAHLQQEVPEDRDETVFDAVAAGLGELGALLGEYHRLTQGGTPERAALERMAHVHGRIDALGGWNISQKVETVLTRLGLPADENLSNCSGGIRRQVMLAQALVSEPDLLLLDEPTNHLDIAAITWLEKYLFGYPGALMFITHDRTMMKHLSTRIVDLDRGTLTSFPGDFDAYLTKKEELLEIEARAAANFDKKLAEEEEWIRRGIKARRTRNEGRVRTLMEMRSQHAERLRPQGNARFGLNAGALSGKLVVDLRAVSFSYGEKIIIRDLSTRILRGDRVGIIGPNGSGKSTLLKLILSEISPTRGQVVLGTRLDVAYFDQHRRALNAEKTVRENMSDSDYVTVQGRSRHVIGYLKDFLFPPARIDSPVQALSGGERNRLLLAKIFTRPANLIVLDEPTNDLDVETLELLEDLLANYEGTLLLVSHDRTFLDNVVTSTLAFEGNGIVREYPGGYEDWERQHDRGVIVTPVPSVAKPEGTTTAPPRSAGPASTKLSYKETRELDALPEKIEALEGEQRDLHALMGSPEFYRQSSEKITAAMERLEAVKKELETCYARWETLETKR
ncbi:MAG TPA: ATP-binding cassette domain-containing protein [Candidatus Binatia bacterium]